MTGDSAAVRPSARVLSAVTATREGQEHKPGQIEDLIEDFVAGRIPDYQMSAWLATIACRGLSLTDTIALTRAYIRGGKRLDLTSLGRVVMDKHSTGGVGDKATLAVVPIVAACGVAVVKMSGRGLGHTGGTVDKLESIPGLRLDLPAAEVLRVAGLAGMVITAQSRELAPGDRATYALRDVTSTVDSIPLIAASIISKKVAVGADGLLLDVKSGAGALMPDPANAVALSETMVAIAQEFGLSCRAAITDMSQPLGYAVGNALEVNEALAVLRGENVPGLSPVVRFLAAQMLQLAEPDLSKVEANERVAKAVDNGRAYETCLTWAAAQGGDARVLADSALLPSAPYRAEVRADQQGLVQSVQPRAVGTAALYLGAGRLAAGEPLDYGAGVVLRRRVGDQVDAGDLLAEVHHSAADVSDVVELVRGAFTVGPEPVIKPDEIHYFI